MTPVRATPVRSRTARKGRAPRRNTASAEDTLAFLAELSQALAVSLDLDRALSEALNRVADFMQVEAASLFLIDRGADPAARVLECRICVGPIDITGLRIAVGQGIVGRTVAENATQMVAEAASDPRVWREADDATGFVTRSLLCAPLATADGPIGALEVINRRDGAPFSVADAELLDVIAAPAALAINNASMVRDLLEQQRLKREFGLARRLQRSLLPKRRRDGFPITGTNRPAHEISGDFYDYFELADGRIGFVIGDISGKGMDAALLMVRAASLLRWIGKEGIAPAAWLARANDELAQTAQDGRFVCALVGYCDRMAKRVHFSGAGFPPVIVHCAGQFSEYPSGGPPLGILQEATFDDIDIALDGGTLYAFSDGATDVRDDSGRPIGNAGVRKLIARHAQAAPEPRLRGLLAELRHLHLVDDTTLLMIETPRDHGAEVVLKRRFPAQATQLRGLRSALRTALDELAVDPLLRDRLVLAVDEACTNIIRHGYGADGGGNIGFRLLRTENVLTFELTDAAPCADPARLLPKALGECRSGGLGLALIDSVMDEWRIEPSRADRGNRLLMRKRIDSICNEDEA